MDAMDIITAADGIRDEDILDAERAAGLWPERVIPIKKKRPAWRTALYVLLPAAAGIVLIVGALGNMRMGSSAPSNAEYYSAEATAGAAEDTVEAANEEKAAEAVTTEEAEEPTETELGKNDIEAEPAAEAEGTATTGGIATEETAAATARMIFADGKLYVEEGPADAQNYGTYDFTIEKVVPETEEPAEEFSANFKAEGGIYLDEDRIAVYADGAWYVFILKE